MVLGSLSRSLYNAVFKKTSSFVLAAVILAYPFERAFNLGTEGYFRQINKGKLYDDMKDSYGKQDEEEEE